MFRLPKQFPLKKPPATVEETQAAIVDNAAIVNVAAEVMFIDENIEDIDVNEILTVA